MVRIQFLNAIIIALIIQTGSHVHAGELSLGLSERLQSTQHKEYISVIVRMAEQSKLKIATKSILDKNKSLRSRRLSKNYNLLQLLNRKT